MLCGKSRVKWLDPKLGRVFVEPFRRHESDRAEPPNVAIVNGAAVSERELQRRVAELALVEVVAGVYQQGAREPRLNDDPISAREIQDDELRPPPCSGDRRTDDPFAKALRGHFAQNIGFGDRDADDSQSGDLTIEIAGDRLSLR